jgi:hypothetical protein
MFKEASAFNQYIGGWDVSTVTDMKFMFKEATAFDQDLSQWCVTDIISEPTGFGNYGTDPVWGTCPGDG